jgi:hypothetical protein
MNHPPQAPENCIRVILKFVENLRRYLQVKVYHQGVPPVSTTPMANFATSTAGVVDTGGKFATGVNITDGKLWEQYQTAETLK